MLRKAIARLDAPALRALFQAQFGGLDAKDPSGWPFLPRHAIFLALAIVIVIGSWLSWLDAARAELEADQATELRLRDDYKAKLGKALNLEPLQAQRERVLQNLGLLEKQLPSKAEMDALLSDINQAGLSRSLQFELFRPGQVVIKAYYAEVPIALRVSGRYHDIGAFASDIAQLSRIVTLGNLSIAPKADGGPTLLTMDATAKTFRYLDATEVAAQRKAMAAKGGAK